MFTKRIDIDWFEYISCVIDQAIFHAPVLRLQEALLALLSSVSLNISGRHSYPPWIVELKAGRGLCLVCLSTHESSQSAVALHHCVL